MRKNYTDSIWVDYFYSFQHKTCRTIDGKYPASYVGKTYKEPDVRHKEHVEALEKGCHKNKFMQYAYDHHGGLAAFDFQVIDELRCPNPLTILPSGAISGPTDFANPEVRYRELELIVEHHAFYKLGGFVMHPLPRLPEDVVRAWQKRTWRGPAWHLDWDCRLSETRGARHHG